MPVPHINYHAVVRKFYTPQTPRKKWGCGMDFSNNFNMNLPRKLFNPANTKNAEQFYQQFQLVYTPQLHPPKGGTRNLRGAFLGRHYRGKSDDRSFKL
jgi:hypothetical protein